jgi:hypothetical protein
MYHHAVFYGYGIADMILPADTVRPGQSIYQFRHFWLSREFVKNILYRHFSVPFPCALLVATSFNKHIVSTKTLYLIEDENSENACMFLKKSLNIFSD